MKPIDIFARLLVMFLLGLVNVSGQSAALQSVQTTPDGRFWVTVCSNGTLACTLQKRDASNIWNGIGTTVVMTGGTWCTSLSDLSTNRTDWYRVKMSP